MAQNRLMGWLVLGFAIVAEVIATSALKAAKGMTRPVPSIIVVVGYALSLCSSAGRCATCSSRSPRGLM